MDASYPGPDQDDLPSDIICITLAHASTEHKLELPPSSTITDLSNAVSDLLSIPPATQKFIVPKLGLLKPPFADPELPLTALQGKQVKLLGTSVAELNSMLAASKLSAARNVRLQQYAKTHPPARQTRRPGASSEFTFLTIRPLAGLPHPERSHAMLERLRDDPGIRAAMAKHKFKVGLLTEMEPLSNMQVSHEGTTRLLGLNRNHGEVIELRLRTDAHDGYRDYKTVRRTLCHELTHNVHGDHDRQFWDLCHQIEREVEAADWKSGGRTAGGGEYYQPEERAGEEFAPDHGGWIGGEFVLGGASRDERLSRREILARAAEARMKQARDAEDTDARASGSND